MRDQRTELRDIDSQRVGECARLGAARTRMRAVVIGHDGVGLVDQLFQMRRRDDPVPNRDAPRVLYERDGVRRGEARLRTERVDRNPAAPEQPLAEWQYASSRRLGGPSG